MLELIQYKCFLIAPGDTAEDLASVRSAAERWNNLAGNTTKERIEVVNFFSTPPLYGERPQATINRYTLEECDFAVALFWHRMGESTGVFPYGVEEELSIFTRNSKPVLVLRKTADVPPGELNGEQFAKLEDFLKGLRSKTLVGEYVSAIDLAEKLPQFLNDLLPIVRVRKPKSLASYIASTSSDASMGKGHSREIFLSFLRNSLLPHGRYLRREVCEPVFFLALHPWQWEPMYCGLPNCSSEEIARQIRQRCEILRQAFSGHTELEDWKILDQVASEVQRSTRETMRGSIAILLSDTGLRMGYESRPNGAAQPPYTFEAESEMSRSLGWFQDAFILAGELSFSVSAFNARLKQRDEESFCELLSHPSNPERVLALLVRHYMRRNNLVDDRFLIFLAEYLLFRAQRTSGSYTEADVKPSQLNHFFLPLRSNGQWKITACWLSSSDRVPSAKDAESSNFGISPKIREEMNIRCSQTYLEAFTVTLMAGLRASRDDSQRPEALYHALSVLWWGIRFLFYRGDSIVLHIVLSHDDMKHTPAYAPPGRRPPMTDGFFRVKPMGRGCATLIIDLRVVPGARGPEVATLLSVDIVEISVRLFELDDQEVSEVAEQLAERILLAVRTA